MKVSLSELQQVARRAIQSYGYSNQETEIILDVLLYAQLRGNNQGLVKLIGTGIPKSEQVGEITTIKETKLSALLNGNNNFGMIVMKRAMEITLQKVSEHGFALVGTNNTASSTGAIGYYARQIAEKGYIGFVFAGSPETVAPHGSIEPLFGTNPIAVGVPTETDPMVFDMATAAIAWYGLVEAKTAGRSIPGDVAIDSEGNLTTDPAAAMDGAILPFDRNYKGYGLNMLVEILTGPLVGATFAGIGSGDWGNLIIATDPELLGDRKEFAQKMTQLVERVKSSKKKDGISEVLIPGERGDKLTQERKESGEIEVEDNLYAELKRIAQV